MSRGTEPWPGPANLCTLAEAAVRAYEELWLAWVPALAVEALFREEFFSVPLPPPSPGAVSASAHLQLTASRKTSILLADEVFDDPQLMDTSSTSWPLRNSATTPAKLLGQFREGLASRADRLGKRWIQPSSEGDTLRPEAVVLAIPIKAVMLVSLGSQMTCTLVRPDSWTPASEPITVPRDATLPLSTMLRPPPAQIWARAWDLRKAELGIGTVLTSPYQSTANGPCIPIRLPSHEQKRLKHPWLLAADGPYGALARVTQFP